VVQAVRRWKHVPREKKKWGRRRRRKESMYELMWGNMEDCLAERVLLGCMSMLRVAW